MEIPDFSGSLTPVCTTREIYVKALRLLNLSGYKKRVRNLAVSVYDLVPHQSEQLELSSTDIRAFKRRKFM